MAVESTEGGARSHGGGIGFLSGGKKRQEELEWLRSHDVFTNLPSKTMLDQDYAQLERRSGWLMVMIRIQRFNQLNAIFGLDLGGATIQRICPILAEFAERMGGQAYRTSVGRLVVLAPAGGDRDGFFSGLEETLGKMEEVCVEDVRGTVYNYHFTFVYAGYCLSDDPADYQDVDVLLKFTDDAAKAVGGFGRRETLRGGVVYDMASRPGWAKMERMADDVGRAWKDHEFEPYYQAVYDLKTGRPVGAEMLVRWRHPRRGLITPGEFLPFMESEGLMMDMDLYMLDAACQTIRRWIDEELVTIPLSVNICKQNIHRSDFLPRLIEIVTSYDIPPVLIELELNETAMSFERTEEMAFLMEQLHRVGFSLTMDDCTSREISVPNLLRELPLDTVKLQPEFLERAEASERGRIFAVNELRACRELGARTVATGIESKEQEAQWLNVGCSVGQGFHLSRPLSTAEFEKLIF